jgi:hypothetical protein
MGFIIFQSMDQADLTSTTPKMTTLPVQHKPWTKRLEKLLKNCAIVNTVPSQVRRLTHKMTGQNFTTDQIDNMCRKATEDKLLDGQYLLNPEKHASSASRILNHLEMKKDASYIALSQDPGSQLFRVSKNKGNATDKDIISIMKALDSLDGTGSQVEVDENVERAYLIREAMTLDDGKTLLLFVAWVTDDDLKFTTMFPEVISFDTTYGTNMERRPLIVGAGTCNNRMNFPVFSAFMPSECKWARMYCYEVAFPALLGKEFISWIKQINIDGERKIYEPLTKLSLEVNSPWYRVKHCICAYHMIDKLFKTKVSVNNKNKAFVEFAKRLVKT